MKNIITALIFILLSSPAFANEKEINIALWELPFNVPAMYAASNNIYTEAFKGKYKVNYIKLPSGPKLIQAMASGRLDIAEGIGAAAATAAQANGAKITIIGANSRSPKAFAVMTNNPSIKSTKDLKGKKTAGTRGSVVHQLFCELLEENNMQESDVEFFPMQVSAAASALLAHRVDAALLVGTEITRAKNGGATVLSDGTGYISGLSLIVARNEFLEENPDIVRKYLEIRNNIVSEIKTNPSNYAELIQKKTSIPLKEITHLMELYDFSARLTEKDIVDLKKTFNYLKKQDLVKVQSLNYAIIRLQNLSK